MDYEIGFKVLTSLLMGWFWHDKRKTQRDIEVLQKKAHGIRTEVAVLYERVDAVKEDTTIIRAKLENMDK